MSDPIQAEVDAALALHRAGKRTDAEQAYRNIVILAPRHAVAWHLLGAVLHEQERSAEGAQCIERAIEINPNDLLFYSNLGEVYRVLRRFDEAIAVLQHVLAAQPQHAESHYKLGLVMIDLRKHSEAVACFERACELDPTHFNAYNNWGCELTRLDRPVDAIPKFLESLRINPELAMTHNNLGASLSLLERATEAATHYRRALELDDKFHEAFSNLLFASNYDANLSPDELYRLHVEYGERFASHFPAPPAWPQVRDPHRRLRIAYCSGDFSRHPVSFFMLPILQAHDRSQFEIVAYSDAPRDDDMTEVLRQSCDHWVSTLGLPDEMYVKLVREHEIDIAVDLGGHTTHTRLQGFARRIAPIQVTYLGYMNTTGLPSMDYRITDAFCDPPGEPVRHVEELVRLPRLFCCYTPFTGLPDTTPLPALSRGYLTFGSLHNIAKLGPATIALWAQALHAVPTAKMRIIRRSLTHDLVQSLINEFAKHGISTERLEFTNTWPGNTHMVCYQDIDLALDVVPWSGHTTCCEGMSMGVPMITLHGDRHAGRMVADVLHAMGRDEWIAHTPEQWVARVVEAASDVDRLAQTRAALRDELLRSPLGDGPALTRELEQAYRGMWHRWVRGAGL